ncbi:hypothetical protein FBF29_04325 [Candidatus Saccharibacteria bacterium oral taxon 488]|nr:hypothetical protein FBF29_04325 [Candidatus Saccharibacteria bacterium oral taxon 488]
MNRQKTAGIALIWVILGIMITGIVALFIYGIVNRPPNRHIGDGKPWNEKMSQGSASAKHVFVDYTDYFCSFCAEVEAATNTNFFKNDYIKSGKVRYEHRVVTLLKEVTNNTESGAHAAFCAADQDKYWQYTHDIVPRIKRDYFDKGIGVKNVATPQKIPPLPLAYFLTSAKNVGMDEAKFTDCMTKKPHQNEIENNTKKALSLGVSGLPYMVVNDYVASGFMGGENGLKAILKAGGAD